MKTILFQICLCAVQVAVQGQETTTAPTLETVCFNTCTSFCTSTETSTEIKCMISCIGENCYTPPPTTTPIPPPCTTPDPPPTTTADLPPTTTTDLPPTTTTESCTSSDCDAIGGICAKKRPSKNYIQNPKVRWCNKTLGCECWVKATC